jgi:hypothetical protein
LRAEALGLPPNHVEVRSQVASVAALQFGWGLFDQLITCGLGVQVDADALSKGVAARSTRLVKTDLITRHAELIGSHGGVPGPRENHAAGLRRRRAEAPMRFGPCSSTRPSNSSLRSRPQRSRLWPEPAAVSVMAVVA